MSIGPGVDRFAVGDRVTGATLVGAFAERVASRPPRSAGRPTASTWGRRGLRGGPPDRLPRAAQRGPGRARGVGRGARGGRRRRARHRRDAPSSGPGCWPRRRARRSWTVCRQKGAEAPWSTTRTEDLKERIKEITGGGADVVIDPVGGPFAERRCGRCAGAGGSSRWGSRRARSPASRSTWCCLKGVWVTGFTMEGLARHQRADVVRDEAEVAELLASGRVVPHICGRYPLEQAARALGPGRAAGRGQGPGRTEP